MEAPSPQEPPEAVFDDSSLDQSLGSPGLNSDMGSPLGSGQGSPQPSYGSSSMDESAATGGASSPVPQEEASESGEEDDDPGVDLPRGAGVRH